MDLHKVSTMHNSHCWCVCHLYTFQPFHRAVLCRPVYGMYCCFAAGCTTYNYYVRPKTCSCQYLHTLTTQAMQLLTESSQAIIRTVPCNVCQRTQPRPPQNVPSSTVCQFRQDTMHAYASPMEVVTSSNFQLLPRWTCHPRVYPATQSGVPHSMGRNIQH